MPRSSLMALATARALVQSSKVQLMPLLTQSRRPKCWRSSSGMRLVAYRSAAAVATCRTATKSTYASDAGVHLQHVSAIQSSICPINSVGAERPTSAQVASMNSLGSSDAR